MKSIIACLLILALLFFSTGCKKDKNLLIPDPFPILAVTLNPSYLSGGQVDSAFAIWKTNNLEQQIKMIVRNDSLIADMSLFNEGNGELTFHLLSNKKYSNQYLGQWVSRKTVSLQKNKTLSFEGPSSFADSGWFPRLELADAIGHRVVIALRPDDAFFIVKNPGHDIVKLTVDRGYWKTVAGIQLAGRGIWECYTSCTDVANDEYFRMLPNRIADKPWNHISIAILFEINDNGEGWLISLEHEP